MNKCKIPYEKLSYITKTIILNLKNDKKFLWNFSNSNNVRFDILIRENLKWINAKFSIMKIILSLQVGILKCLNYGWIIVKIFIILKSIIIWPMIDILESEKGKVARGWLEESFKTVGYRKVEIMSPIPL